MAFSNVNIGTTANDKTGDNLRTAFGKINDNFANTAPLASPIFTGSPGVVNSVFYISGPASERAVRFETALAERFWIGIDGVPETGNNVGSDFNIRRFDDTGTYVDTPLSINRATGTTTFSNVAGITKTMVGLGNVDNTSDVNKPVSTAANTAINLRALTNPTTRTDIQHFGTPNFASNSFYTAWDEGSDGRNVYFGWARSGSSNSSIGANDRGYGSTNLMIDSRTDMMNVNDGGFGVGIYGRIVLEGGDAVNSGYGGGRIAVLGQIIQSSLPRASTYGNPFKVGVNGVVVTYTGDGGANTGSGAKGAYVGMHALACLKSGAVNVEGVNGMEINIVGNAGSSVKFGTLLNLADGLPIEPSTAYYGTVMYRFQDSLGDGVGIGPKYWLAWSDIGTYAPVRTDGTGILMGGHRVNSTGTWTVAQGIDLREFTITGSIIRGAQMQLEESTLHLGSVSSTSVIDNYAGSASSILVIRSLGSIAIRPAAGSYTSFGTYTSGSITPTGYIEITDDVGTVRKIAVQ